MAPTLGKRKRQAEERREGSPESSVIDEEEAQAIFRRHFEAQFKPLPTIKRVVEPVEPVKDDEDDESESEWDGISDTEDTKNVEVIEHTVKESQVVLRKSELKAFMSSKPPLIANSTEISKIKTSKTPAEDDSSEAANLKKDLELQRLLSESHLLDKTTLTMTGANRHKALDMRLQELGGKGSIFTQEKMPMSHRKGIMAKSSAREVKRRKEAKENNIILEKVKVKKRARMGKGSGGVNVSMPGVGKFSGGMLSLSNKDIMDIEGRKESLGGGGRGGKGGRGRGGKRR